MGQSYGLGDVFGGEAAGEDEAFFGEALLSSFEEVPREGFADSAVESRVVGVEEDVGAGVVGDGVEAGFIAHLEGFDDMDVA